MKEDELVDDDGDDYIPQEEFNSSSPNTTNYGCNKSENDKFSDPTDAFTASKTKEKNITEKILKLSPGVVNNLLSAKRGRPCKGQEKAGEADKWHECHVCLKKFSMKGNFKQHLLTHTDKKPYTCDFHDCKKSFRTKETCEKHKLAHQGIKPFSCEICRRGFTTNHALKEHRSRHSDTKLYACSVCNRHFRQISCLSRHMVLHSGEKKYSCNICDRKFAQPAYLRSHIRTHTGEKRFSCELCSKVFGYRSDLNRHAIIHRGTRPYQCSVCNLRFNDRSSCRRHLRNHTDEKGFACETCGGRFTQIARLETHECCTGDNQSIRSTVHRAVNENNQDAIDIQNVQDQIQRVLVQLREARQIENSDETGINIHIITIPDTEDASRIAEQVRLGTIDLEHDQAQPISLLGEETPTEGLNDEHDEQLSDLGFITCLPDNNCVDETGTSCSRIIEETATCLTDENEQIYSDISPVNTNNSTVRPVESVNDVDIPSNESISQHSYDTGACSNNGVVSSSKCFERGTLSLLADACEPENSLRSQGLEAANSQLCKTDHNAIIDSNYIENPQFSSQEYYNWLSAFVTYCKTLSFPLRVDVYQKINHIYKVLSDVMARPTGVLSNKDNFRSLMTMTSDLNAVIHGHMNYVLNQLPDDPVS
ncbi:uncharacterized protein LOC141899651 isoform X2 [Tubulanus polymorphus]